MKFLKYILFVPTSLLSVGLIFTLFLTLIDLIFYVPTWLFIVLIFILSSLIFTVFSFVLNFIIQTLWKLSPHHKYSLIVFSLALVFVAFNAIFTLWIGDEYRLLGKIVVSGFILFLTFDLFNVAMITSSKQRENSSNIVHSVVYADPNRDEQPKFKYVKDQE